MCVCLCLCLSRYGTPVLNLASRVAKSARVGQILMVGRNQGMTFLDSRAFSLSPRARGELDSAVVIEHGYYKVRGFGQRPRFLYEIAAAGQGGLLASEGGGGPVCDNCEDMESVPHPKLSFEVSSNRSSMSAHKLRSRSVKSSGS